MSKRTISFGAALTWLEKQKLEILNNNNLTSAYNNAHHDMAMYADKIAQADYELEKYQNSIDSIKNTIITVRNKKKLVDKLVDEMNKKSEAYNEIHDRRLSYIEGYMQAQRLIENYDRDDEKKLFFFWSFLSSTLPDLTPGWTEFMKEHEEFFYRYHYEQQIER